MQYDIIIIGGGPAGITAGIYAKRAGKNVAIIERFMPGGQLNLIGEIENYTGFKKIEGADLAMKFYEHALEFDIPFITDEVVDLELKGDIKKIIGKSKTYQSYSVILALGSHARELKIEGETEFKGQGVSYCALCDGNFFKNKSVAIVGSGDSAFSDAIYLANICSQIYILTKEQLKLHNYTENELEKYKNIKLLKGALANKIIGDSQVKQLIYMKDGKEKSLDVKGVFVAIGRTPDTSILINKINLSSKGFVLSDEFMKTSEEGVFACGDIREGNIKQISCAVGEGALAGTEASKYVSIKKMKIKN